MAMERFMTDKEVMQMALDALDDGCGKYTDEYRNLIEALRTALAQPEPEPVAVVQQEAYGRGQVLWVRPASEFADGTLLYTAPPKKDEPVIDKSMAKRIATQLGWEPKKEWVNLTVEERETLRDAYQDSFSGLISAVQITLREKNT